MSLIATIGASAKPPAAGGDPSAVVSGGGEGNGEYSPRGQDSGFPYFNLVGQPDNLLQSGIASDVLGNWSIFGSTEFTVLYFSQAPADLPWNVVTWLEDAGASPAPTVTQG